MSNCGRVSEDGTSFLWKEEDLFEKGLPSDVWSDEIMMVLVRQLTDIYHAAEYEKGLMVITEIEFPDKPKESPWWRWIPADLVREEMTSIKEILDLALEIIQSILEKYRGITKEFLIITFDHQTDAYRPVSS